MADPIDEIVNFPPRTDAGYKPKLDLFFNNQLQLFVAQLNAVAVAFNNNATNSTSTSPVLISVANGKVFNVGAGKSYLPGMWVIAANSTTNYIIGIVSSYSGSTLTVDAKSIGGSGTLSSWNISLCPPQLNIPGDHEVVLNTGAGNGTTNTLIRRYVNVQRNVGTAISYADSATLGASFTINTDGVYAISRTEVFNSTNTRFGITKDGTVATAIDLVAASERLAIGQLTATPSPMTINWTGRLVAGDVIRPHDGPANTSVSAQCRFSIVRVA